MRRGQRTFWLILILFHGSSVLSGRPQEVDLNQQAVITTSEGSFVLSLYADKAPLHVKLFLSRVAAGAYDGTTFSYVAKWGVIQGGAGPDQTIGPDPAAIGEIRAEESGLRHSPGTLSLVLDSSDGDKGQFFICVTPQPGLDGRYTPIGVVAANRSVPEVRQYAMDKKDNLPVVFCPAQ